MIGKATQRAATPRAHPPPWVRVADEIDEKVADRDRDQGLVGGKGELLRRERRVQTQLHTSASARVFMERNGVPRTSMEEYVLRKSAPILPFTPRVYAAGPWLPRNLRDTEDDETPKPMSSDSVFSRPNRSVRNVPSRSARTILLSPSCLVGVAGYGTATRCDMRTGFK